MSLQWISFMLGILALIGGMLGLFRTDLVKRFAEIFPRSVIPAWVFTALCCWLGLKEALNMNMGFLNNHKQYLYLISPLVFVASVTYLKELLAPRALGGFLLLIAVPIVRTAALSGKPLFQVVVALAYLWIIFGLFLLMSPWYFRKFMTPFQKNNALLKVGSGLKVLLGVGLILLGVFAYSG